MGRRSRRKVDAVIGVALVLGLIGSEMRPDGVIVGSKSPTLLEKSDVQISSGTAETGVVDQTLVEELGRIKGLDENIVDDKGGVILPVLPMPMPKTAVRPDHCYSSFSGKEVKQEPGLVWQLPPAPQTDLFQPVQHFPVTEVQYIPSALELLQRRVGIGGQQPTSAAPDLQAELADLVAAIHPQSSSGEQSPLSFSSGVGANPEELLNDILAESGQLAFDEPPPPFSPKLGLLDPMDSGFLDPTQDIFRWMEQGAFDSECATTSQSSDLFGCAQGGSPNSYGNDGKIDLPAAETDRTIDELLFALEREDKASSCQSQILTTTSKYQQKDPLFSELPAPAAISNFTTSSRKRKSESSSSWSSASSKSEIELPIIRDEHNHTYDDGAAERRAKKMPRTRSGTSDESCSGVGPLRCRDISDFTALNIPFSYDTVISAEPSQFNTMVGDHRLNDEQRTLMRAARRRAKNRNAARQCRQRRVDEVEDLADEVETLEDERNTLVAQMDEIDAQIAAQRAANERLQAYIIETYSQQRPPTMRDAEYRLQSNRNGTFSLVEQRGIRA